MKRLLATALAVAALSPAALGQAAPSGSDAEPGATAAEPYFEPPPPAVARRIGSLIEQLRGSSSFRERNAIVDRIIDYGSDAIPLIAAELERRSRDTEPAMVYAIGAIGDPAVLPLLRGRVADTSGKGSLELYYAMALAGDDTVLSAALRSANATMMFGQGGNIIDYIAGAMGAPAVPILIRDIPLRSESSRVAALGALGTVCDSAAVDFLIEWSARPEPLDRRFALVALSRIGDARALPALVAALDDEDRLVREAAVEGLGYLHQPAAVKPLAALLPATPGGERTEDEQRRRIARQAEGELAAWSLGLLGRDDATKALVASYRGAPPDERGWALRALAITRNTHALDPLTEAALTGGPKDSSIAVEGLREIDDPAATKRLLRVCEESRSTGASLVAAVELAQRADPRATPCIVQALRKDLEKQRGLSQEALDILDALPHAANPGAAEAIETLAEELTAPALTYRLRIAAHNVRLVDQLGNDIEPWLELLDSGSADEVDLAIRRLGVLGDPRAVDALQRALGRLEPERAHLIPQALGRIGSERGTPFLISLLTSDVYRVEALKPAREEAARALAAYAATPHVIDALDAAFRGERGRLFMPLMAIAKIGGAAEIPRLVELKTLLMRRRDKLSLERHERINWAIRMLRAGKDIPLEDLREP